MTDEPEDNAVEPQAEPQADIPIEPTPISKNGGEQTITDLKREARDMIPAGPGGVSPITWAQMVTFAQDMAKAKLMIPAHFRGSVGDCLGVVEIAAKSGLIAYMVAQKIYVVPGGNGIAFESQLFHALAQGSGEIVGALHCEYEGEGDERVCICTGRVRGDDRIKEHRSPPLKQLHPGHVKKKNAKTGEEYTAVRGSPLWDRKPDQQLWYDTSRDWIRKFIPRAVLGIYSPEEFEENPELMKDVTPPLSERLAAADRPQTGEGFRRGEHLAEELARISPNQGVDVPAVEPEDAAEPEVEPATKARSAPLRGLDRLKRFRGREQPEPHQRAAKSRRGHMPTKEEVRRAADRAERGRGIPPKSSAPPFELSAYGRQALEWIEKVTDIGKALDRWDSEQPLRAEFRVGLRERKWLEDKLATVLKALRK